MILIDFNNNSSITYANVIKTVLENEKKLFKKSGLVEITDKHFRDIRKGYFHLMFKSLLLYKQKYSFKYNDIIIVSDYRKDMYWRKQLSSVYKANRDDKKTNEFDNKAWSKFNDDRKYLLVMFKILNFYTIADVTTVFNKVEVSLEADEIIGIISQQQGKHLIIANDGDYEQTMLNNINVDILNPITQKLVKKTKKEINAKNIMSCILGQAKDNIMPIKYQTEISIDFITWMKEKYDLEITQDMILLLKQKYSSYMNEYKEDKALEDIQLIKDGTRKIKRNLSAYKKPNFGEVTAQKLLDKMTLEEILKENTMYQDRYELNEKLYYFDKIPKEINDVILERYKNISRSYDMMNANKFFSLFGIPMSMQPDFQN